MCAGSERSGATVWAAGGRLKPARNAEELRISRLAWFAYNGKFASKEWAPQESVRRDGEHG